jgi:HEAT repeats
MTKRMLPFTVGLLLVAGMTVLGLAAQTDRNDRTDRGRRSRTPSTVPGFQPPPGAGAPALPPGAAFPGQRGGLPGQFPGAQPPVTQPQPDYREIIPTLMAALADDDGDVRQSVAYTLARIGQPAVKPLLAILKDKDKHRHLRANAAYVLGKMGSVASEAAPALAQALKESDRELRRRAAYALARLVVPVEDNNNPFGPGGGFRGGRASSSFTRSTALPDPGVLLPTIERDAKRAVEKPGLKPERK